MGCQENTTESKANPDYTENSKGKNGGMPLTVYADILVIVNLYIDFFLLWCVEKFLHLRGKSIRLALGALTGALLALTALLPGLPNIVQLLIGIGTALAVTGAAFAPLRPREFFRAAVCFWAATFLLCGFFLFLLRFFAPKNVAVLGNVLYFDLSPTLLFVFTVGAYVVFSLGNKLFSGMTAGLRCQWVVVENRETYVRLYLKADTGNALREPFSGLPVLVCRAESLGATAPEEAVEFAKAGKIENSPAIQGLRLVPFESVGGAGVLPAFRPQKVTVEKTGQLLPCYIALFPLSLQTGEQTDGFYNPDQFPELRNHE